jgi:hypothetical protein
MVTHRTSHFFIPARLAVHRNCLNHAPPKLPQRPSARRQFPPAHELTSSSWMAPLTGGHQETVHFTSLAPLCNSTADVCRTPCRYSRYAREPHHSHHVCSGRGTRPRPVVTERVHHVCYSPCYDLLVLDLWSSFIIISSAVVSLVRRSKQCYYKVPKHRLTLDLRPASLTNTQCTRSLHFAPEPAQPQPYLAHLPTRCL